MLMMFSYFMVACVVTNKSTGVIIIQSIHVIDNIIRSMSHSVICNDRIRLIKLCGVFWALNY